MDNWNCVEDGYVSDVFIGRCLEHLGITTMDTRDHTGRDRFMSLDPASHIYLRIPEWYERFSAFNHQGVSRPIRIVCSL